MAVIKTYLNCELGKAVKVQYLDGNLFSQDNQANQIIVKTFENGEPVTLSGDVSASIVRADGGTVAATGGTISGNTVSITLPSAAYLIPGVVSIAVKVTSSSVVTTIAAIVANVYQSSTDTAIDPGTIMPSIQTLIAAIDAAIASIPADYSSLWTKLAPVFSTDANYVAGQYVTYNSGLYRFNRAHTGAWSASDVTAVSIGGELTDLKSTIVYPNGAIEEISGIKSYPFCRNNWNLTTGEPWTENANYKFIDGLIVPTSTLYVCCTNDNYNMFYLKYNKNGTYVSWAFVEATFRTHHAYLSKDYNYRIAITQKNNTIDPPTLEDAKYVLIWEIPEEEYANLYKPQTYLTDRSIYRKKKLNHDGELELTWIRENRRLGDGTIIENPSNHNMITTIEMIDCTTSPLFIVNDSNGDLFLIKFNSNGTYNSYTSAADAYGKQWGWLEQGYYYYPLVTTGDISEQFKIRVFSSIKSEIRVPSDMKKIQAACDFAKDGDTILISNGTYAEDVSVYTKNVNLIGESRDYTIIKTTVDKYSKPPLEIAKGCVQNITFYSDDTDRASGESEDHSYAVHIDYVETIGNTVTLLNCKLYAKNNSALGVGLRNNGKIKCVNCEFVSTNSYGIFAHTQVNPEQIGTNQYIEIDNCVIESETLNKCVSLMSALGSGNDGHYVSYNSIYKADGNAPTDYDRKTYQNTGGTFDIDPFSFGNNVSHMNGNKHN